MSGRMRRLLFLSILLSLMIGFLLVYKKIANPSVHGFMNHSLKMIHFDVHKTAALHPPKFIQESDHESALSANEKEPTEDESLKEKINEILSNSQLEGALVGVSIRNAEDGEIVYEHEGDIRLKPASNMKLLTAMTAIEILGLDHQFETELFMDGKQKGSVLEGDLYIKGKGDPTLLKEDFDNFAKKVKDKGIKEIKGNIIGDDTWYDDVRYSPDLNWSDEYNYVGSAVSALTASPNEDFQASSIIVRVSPSSSIGDEPKVELIPDNDYVTIDNQAKTVGAHEHAGLSIDREHGTNHLIVKGTIASGYGIEFWRSVWEPTYFALHLLKDSLLDQGIQLSDEVELKRGKIPTSSESITKRQSIPLEELLFPFMKLSNNSHGEILVKEMGRAIYNDGSWRSGLKAMGEQLGELGADLRKLSLRDGSGMSYRNLIPANELTKLLYKIQDKKWFDVFLDSQPLSGDPDPLIGGTLRNRLNKATTKGKVQAKTGTLASVNTLSGYLTTNSDERFIFSIMINNYVDGWMPQIQDAIIESLVEHDFSKEKEE